MKKNVSVRLPQDLIRSIEANKLLTESFGEAVRRHLKQGLKANNNTNSKNYILKK